MKRLFTILLTIVTISLSAQKLPNPPKADAIGKESSNFQIKKLSSL